MFFKIGVLKHFANFTGKHPRWSLFSIKFRASGLQLYWKETPTLVFSYEIAKSLRTTFYTEHLRWLLLVAACSKDFYKRAYFYRFIKLVAKNKPLFPNYGIILTIDPRSICFFFYFSFILIKDCTIYRGEV